MSGADDLLRRGRELLAAMPEDGRPDVDRIREAVVLAGEQLKAEDYWAEHEHEAAAGLLAPDTDPPADASSGRMRFLDLDELRAQAAAQGRRFLIDELWPDGDYGVLGAEDKAGKTWAIDDLGVSIVTGTPWLGRYEVAEGSVLLLHGEGGAPQPAAPARRELPWPRPGARRGDRRPRPAGGARGAAPGLTGRRRRRLP
jgi:AAA domain